MQIISLYQDPEGKKVFKKSAPGSSMAGGNTTHNAQDVDSLKTRIKQLEQLVSTMNVSAYMYQGIKCYNYVVSYNNIVYYTRLQHGCMHTESMHSTVQWRRKIFCCRGAENMRTWCTMVVRQVDCAHNDLGGSVGMLPQESFSFLCVSKSILVHSGSMHLLGLLHVHDSTAKNIHLHCFKS